MRIRTDHVRPSYTRHALCRPDARQGPLVHPGRRGGPGPGDRRQQHGLHLRERRARARPSVQGPRADHAPEFARHGRPRTRLGVSYPDYRGLARAGEVFHGAGGVHQGTMQRQRQRPPAGADHRRVVTANAFRPHRRAADHRASTFPGGDDRRGPSRSSSSDTRLWKNRYGSDPAVVGRTIRINDVPTTIIGVMPEGMRFPTNADMWLPLVPDAAMRRVATRGS